MTTATDEINYDVCKDQAGEYFLFKYVPPAGEDPEEPEPEKRPNSWWYLTPDEYRARFSQNMNLTTEQNPLGYGPKRKFIPPLYKPKMLLSEIDRHFLVLGSFPLQYVSS